MRFSALALLTAAWLCVAPAWAQAERPVADLTRLPDGTRGPVIDGVLDDEAWQEATLLGALVQVIPIEGGTPTEHTEVRITYDRDAIYVGVHAFDSEPDEIIAKGMVRDGSLVPDDRITIVFDTFLDRRNGFLFSTNPNGARFDGIIENNGTFRTQWDGIWFADAKRTDDGWTCEFAIPFKTLNFDPEGDTWGFNLLRNVRRRNEENRWSSAKQNRRLTDVSEVGDLRGLRGMDQGLGLDFIPGSSLGWTHERDEHRQTTNLDPSFDAFYKITPSVTGAVTVNTDFSDAAVDARQINLSRFNLFFPETRDFFLQDAGIFDFAVGGDGSVNAIPFFSRRIGLDEVRGEVVDIRAGAKVTGRVGPLNFGLMDVQMAGHSDVDAKNLAVGRAKLNFGEESFAGLIATHGDPITNGSNTLLGTDVTLRSSKLIPGQITELRGWFQHTHTPGAVGDDVAFGARAAYPNDKWNAALGFKQLGPDYNPALGFTNRTDIRNSFGSLRRRWRPEGHWLRIIDTSIFFDLFTDLGNDLESLLIFPTFVRLENQAGDFISLQGSYRTEILEDEFEIFSDVVLPKDRYDFSRLTLNIGTARSRPVSAEFSFGSGSFWSGHIRSGRALFEWRASKHFFASAEYLRNSVRLPEGDFTTRLGRVRLNVVFTPDLSWETFLQFDNVSDSVGWNSRLRWIVNPGEEIVLVWNQALDVEDYGFRGDRTNLIGKISWTFRF